MQKGTKKVQKVQKGIKYYKKVQKGEKVQQEMFNVVKCVIFRH